MPTLHDTGDIRLLEDFVPDPQGVFEQLVNGITWDTRMRARKVASFGVPYNYSGIEWPEAPFTELLRSILDRVTPAVGFTPNNCLLNFYPNGDSTMGFHSDETDVLEPGTGIAVLSVGAERTITFRRIADTTVTERYALPPGSLLLMSPEMQAEWKHAILTDGTTNGGRVSLTFRRMKP